MLRSFALISAIALLIIATPGRADTTHSAADAAAEQCKALTEADFSGVADAPTQIGTAKLVDNAAELLNGLASWLPPETLATAVKNYSGMRPFCRVTGYVVPNVGFEMLLPVGHWNGKFLHVGCGGWCGTTSFVALSCVKHPDYACIGTDMGHTGVGGLWYRDNLQAQVDFSYRATHVATLAGKAIVARYYATTPHKSYFMGCSTGGYQAMVEAQRFPWDFNGIVAGAPDMDEADLAVRGLWIKKNFLGADGKPVLSSADIQLVHSAALAKCDMDDGVKDGIIGDPFHCKFDPQELLCKAGKDSKCLSAQQVQAVKNIYGVPVTSKGVRISSRGVFPGSENNWSESFTQTWGDMYFKDIGLFNVAGKEWSYKDYDFDRDAPRSGVGVMFPDTNPDLRQFKATGAKLLSYQGTNDSLEIPGGVFDYYDTVERTMGGRAATQDFYRLFAIPGMNHCLDGDGVSQFDYLSYLETWVEQGRAPDVMVGAHFDGLKKYESSVLDYPAHPGTPPAFTRPVYPYPLHAKYKGKGDPNKAENFGPAQ